MAEATAPKARRKSSGPRQQRPVFAVVRYSDSDGNPVQLDQNKLQIVIERDSAKLVEMLTGGSDFSGAAVVRVELPQPKPRASAEASA